MPALNIFGLGRPGRPLPPRRTDPETGDIPKVPLPPPRSIPGPSAPLPGLDPCIQECMRPVSNGTGGFTMAPDPDCLAECRGQEDRDPGGDPVLGDEGVDVPVADGGGGGGTSRPTATLNFDFLNQLFSNIEGAPNFLDNPLLQQLQSFLSTELEGPFGLDPDVIRRQRNIITGSAAQREQQALQNLAASLNTVGQVGGGRQIELGRQITEDTRRGVSEDLQSLATLDALRAQQDRDAIVNQVLGFGGLAGQAGSQDITRMLGLGDLELRRLLGEGNLALGFGNLDLATQQFIANLAFQQMLASLGLYGLD